MGGGGGRWEKIKRGIREKMEVRFRKL